MRYLILFAALTACAAPVTSSRGVERDLAPPDMFVVEQEAVIAEMEAAGLEWNELSDIPVELSEQSADLCPQHHVACTSGRTIVLPARQLTLDEGPWQEGYGMDRRAILVHEYVHAAFKTDTSTHPAAFTTVYGQTLARLSIKELAQ